jgi:hypothetical protein
VEDFFQSYFFVPGRGFLHGNKHNIQSYVAGVGVSVGVRVGVGVGVSYF